MCATCLASLLVCRSKLAGNVSLGQTCCIGQPPYFSEPYNLLQHGGVAIYISIEPAAPNQDELQDQ
eukprot:4677458-Pleurochrysis_carterae.AAC.2